MAGFWDYALPLLGGAALTKTGRNALFGTEGKYRQMSTLTPEQKALHQQLLDAGMGEGAGGAFGSAADYYRNLMSDNPADLDAFSAPELRRFNEQTIPDLAEQFAGMGAGNLSSSGFRNAAVSAGTDLSERLGAIRANLRQQGAAGLANIGQAGLYPIKENIYEPGSPGLLQQAAPAAAQAAVSYYTGTPPVFSAGGAGTGVNPTNSSPGKSTNSTLPINFAQNPTSLGGGIPSGGYPSPSPSRNAIGGNKIGANRNPYTNQPSYGGGFNLPNFNPGMR